MHRKSAVLIFSAAFLVAISFSFSSFASVCGCKPALEEEALQKSDVAFYGVVEKLEVGDEPRAAVWNGELKGFSWRENVATFGVVKILKGSLNSVAVVQTSSDSGMCGVEFMLGRCYAVFAHRNGKGVLSTSICNGTQLGCEKPIKDERISGTSESWPQQEKFVLQSAKPIEPPVDEEPKLVQSESQQPVDEKSKLIQLKSGSSAAN